MKIGSLIIDLDAKKITPEEQELLAHPLVGGVIFFARNFESGAQLKALCDSIRTARQTPLLLMVDQEGGRVQRFKTDFSSIPPMASFGAEYDSDPASAERHARECGHLLASELLSFGIHLNLGPVLDLNKGLSSVIGDRAFHENPHIAARLACVLMQGMKSAGMAAVGKHFPGHGSIQADTHLESVSDIRSLQEVEQTDLIPFYESIRAGIPAIMSSHLKFPQVDPLPVTYSNRWLNEVLRERLGFEGTVFSDDLNMKAAAISSSYADRVQAAAEAGCDFMLLCNNRKGVIEVLDKLDAAQYQIQQSKWAPFMAGLRFNERL